MKTNSILHIGFDDTDSRNGMCTTFLAYKIVEYLKKERVKFLDYPYLIRFNPNIPWKTRGNGAVALKIQTDKSESIKQNIIRFIKKYSAIKDGANPGLVFYQNNEIPIKFIEFARQALCNLIKRNKAKEFVLKNGLESFYLGNGQGLIGAIGALSYDFDDHTFELISYRNESNFGKKREIFKESVKKMQDLTYPMTFNSFDEKKNRILIAPHGPDPVFFGIRGENVNSIIHSKSLVYSSEKFNGYMVFRTNQGTGAHLKYELDVNNLKPFSSGFVIGMVLDVPKIGVGGHLIFSILKNDQRIKCAIYKPTKMTKIASKLIRGDIIKVGGGIRKATKIHPRVLNVEFFEVLKLAKNIKTVNPYCYSCNKRAKSKGKNQGFECVKCSKTFTNKTSEKIPREIECGLYIPSMSAHRHLTRPIQRMGKLNIDMKFDDSKKWFYVSKPMQTENQKMEIKINTRK